MPIIAECLADALADDPFYATITPQASDRRDRLTRYFAYSLIEGQHIGLSTLDDGGLGAAIWAFPQPAEVLAQAANAKMAHFESVLDAQGLANYGAMLDFMATQAENVVDPQMWYLSILGVAPHAQGQGRGRRLLEPILAQANREKAICYLETFSPRNVTFYQRLGFVERKAYYEPTAEATCWIMVRDVRQA